MNAYESSPATQLVATHCAICARALVDAVSVERGIGPDCAAKYGAEERQGEPDFTRAALVIGARLGATLKNVWRTGDVRAICNVLVYRVAADRKGSDVGTYILAIRELGFARLADTLSTKIGRVEVSRDVDGSIAIKAPYCEAFNAACRGVKGSRWHKDRGVRTFPEASGPGAIDAIKRCFAGRIMISSKGQWVTL